MPAAMMFLPRMIDARPFLRQWPVLQGPGSGCPVRDIGERTGKPVDTSLDGLNIVYVS